MEDEIWKPIEGYELYEVSNLGRVRSYRTTNVHNPNERANEPHYLSFNSNRRYQKFDLCKNGDKTTTQLHQVVALAFVPNPDSKKYIDHIDRNKSNNKASNLRWVTPQENSANLPIYNTNTTGEKNIAVRRHKRGDKVYTYFTVEFVRGGNIVFSRHGFKTLEEAVKCRDEYLNL